MTSIRQAAVAGQFYTADPGQLAAEVDALLAAAEGDDPCPKAVIAPHAGHIYSGAVAARAYARIRNGADRIKKVVLLGPSHRVAFEGIAATSADFYATPLGQIPVDKAGVDAVCKLPASGILDAAHNSGEHSLEVHLPFLQRALGDFALLPLVVGQANAEQVATVLESQWGDDETLVVISSDLSHFENYDEARRKDSATTLKIESLHTDLVGEQACGCRPINGLLHVLKKKNLQIETIDLRNSGDTAGDKNRVVGYGSYVVSGQPGLARAHKQQLLHLARTSILHRLQDKADFSFRQGALAHTLREERATFVTLKINGRLRGCIGSMQAHRALAVDVAHNAQAAAYKDHRFSPLTAAEYPLIDLHISILSPPEDFVVASRQELLDTLRPGIDGLVLRENGKQATYLPSVWDQLKDPAQFVAELRAKAGLPRDGWSDGVTLARYTTEEFS